MMGLNSQVNIDEALRYMGCPPERAGAALRETAKACSEEIVRTARPRWAYRVVSLQTESDGVRLESGLFLPGESIREHLAQCSRAAVFCVTLGAEIDRLIRRAEQTDMGRALILDCCASAAVEGLCDEIESILHSQFPQCFFPFRFSPGYGDLPLTVQRELLELLEAPVGIGLCATDSYLLTPRKSVTGILGISDREIERRQRSCTGCPAQKDCLYRIGGGHCGIS